MMKKKLKLFFLIIIFVIVSLLVLLTRIQYNFNQDIKLLSEHFIEDQTRNAKLELNAFFLSVERIVDVYVKMHEYGQYENLDDLVKLNSLFMPLLEKSSQIVSLVVADTLGNDYLIQKNNSYSFQNRLTKNNNGGNAYPEEIMWEKGGYGEFFITNKSIRNESYNPKERPWYINAMQNKGKNWSDPYIFYTTKMPGVSLSIRCDGNEKLATRVLSFNILIAEISKYTSNIKLNGGAKLLVFTDKGKIIGVPADENNLKKSNGCYNDVVNCVDYKMPELVKGYRIWDSLGRKQNTIEYKVNRKIWRFGVDEYLASNGLKLYIGVLVPDTYFVGKIKERRSLLYIGFLLVVIISLISLLAYYNKQRDVGVLEKQKQIIQDNYNVINHTLEEKEMLLKEVYHRVKNNLQLVSAMLSLQALKVTDPLAKKAFENSKARLGSMALLHEKLYKSSDLANINAADYFTELINNLIESYAGTITVDKEIHVENFAADADMVLSLGLILNELITNSMKYAFKNREFGKIKVDITRDQNGKVLFVYSDDGIGVSEEILTAKAPSLGFELIKSLVNKLNGKYELFKGEGYRIAIAFDENK